MSLISDPAESAGFTTSTGYDTNLKPYVLLPKNPIAQDIDGTTATVTSAAYVHGNLKEYWAPLNRPDYEDMSWNLNKLKLLPDNLLGTVDEDVGASIGTLYAAQHSLMRLNSHRRVSNILLNNALPGGVTTQTTPFPKGASAPYMYNMVFNYGAVDYVFSNKGMFSAEIELVLYRIKKNKSPKVSSDNDERHACPGMAYASLYTPIIEGYVKQVADKFGTDDLGGRDEIGADVLNDPKFPYLPKLSKTKQGDLPYAEVMRKKFVLAPGGRRPVNIVLPGDVYDPCNISSSAQTSDTDGVTGLKRYFSYAILDDHAYAVAISVNGTIQSRNLHKDAQQNVVPQPIPGMQPPVDVPFLDLHGEADVQYYCSYSEHVGACQYKTPTTKTIYCRGAAAPVEVTGDDDLKEEAVLIIPAEQVMRTPTSNHLTQMVDANNHSYQTWTKTNAGAAGGSAL
ncbi:MAG TPA: hypothetical protein EYN64_06560 [Flavobacteriales bacterium]|nr:hypothetical protein [Flavobacteriales bacterium]